MTRPPLQLAVVSCLWLAAACLLQAQTSVESRAGSHAAVNETAHLTRTQVSTLVLNAPWTPLGPAPLNTASFGPVTGRVTSVAVDPSDASGNTVFLGSAGGGIWKSTNAAAAPSAVHFTPLTDALGGYDYSTSEIDTISIGALSVQPGGTGVVLAGTGDPNNALNANYGDGVLRSADGGATWTLVSHSSDSHFSAGSDYYFFGLSFAGLAWSTVTPNLVVAAVASAGRGGVVNAGYAGSSAMGLYYSLDAGQTWRLATVTDGSYQTLQTPGMNFDSSGGNAATGVVWNPVRHLFVAALRYHGYYQSGDGITWTRMTQQPGSGLTSVLCPANPGGPGSGSCPIFRGALAVQPATGDTFAITTDLHNIDQGVFEDVCAATSGSCQTSAITFAQKLPSAALESRDGTGAIAQAGYNLWLKAIPQGADTLLFAGTTDIFRCSLQAGCIWRNTTHVNTCGATAGVSPAQHAVDWVPGTGTLFFGNDSGLWRTTDAVGQQSTACAPDDGAHFDNLNAALGSLAEVTSVAQSPADPGALLASMIANGTAAVTSPAPGWQQVLAAGDGYVGIDPASGQDWYATSGPGVAITGCTAGAQCNASTLWTQSIASETQVANDGNALPAPAVWTLDPADSTQLLLGTCRVWRGPAGAQWPAGNAISPMLDGNNAPACQGNAQIRSLAASDALAGQPPGTERIYAGMAGPWDGGATAPGRLFGTTVGPADTAATVTWSNLSASPVVNDQSNNHRFNPGRFAISSIAVDPHDSTGQTVYAAIAGFSGSGITQSVNEPLLYASTDGGQHWTNITANLPDAPVNAIAVDPENAGIVYVGTDVGVFVAGDVATCGMTGGVCWNAYGTGMPQIPVMQLLPFTGGGQALLRAATSGRGVWQIPLASQSTTGGSLATAMLAPASLAFGSQQVQTISAAQTVMVKNAGNIALQIAQIAVSGDFVETNACPASLVSGASCAVQVAFTPAVAGARSGLLTLSANVAGGQQSVAFSGSGTPGGAALLTPSLLTFANTLVGTQSAIQYLTVSNTGGGSLALGNAAVSSGFTIAANTCSASLPPQTSCTVGILFAPAAAGQVSGAFTISDAAGTQTAPLLGAGITVATDALSPRALSFGPQPLGTVSTAQTATLTNSGDSPLTLIHTTVTGEFTVNNLCGGSLAAHASCAVQVAYAPQTAGAGAGLLTVTDALQSQTVTLNGSGVSAGGISLSPSALDFGVQGVGQPSAARVLTLSNNGSAALKGLTTQASGDFQLQGSTYGAALQPGVTCTLQVVFTPAQTGARSGAFTLASSSFAQPLVSNLRGMGMDFQITVVGRSSVIVVGGKTATYTLQVTPVGATTGSLAIVCTGAPAGAACTPSPSPLTLATGASTTLTVIVATPAQTSAAAAVGRGLAGRGLGGQGLGGRQGLADLALGCLLPVGWVLRRRPRGLAAWLLAFTGLALAGCGVTVKGGNGGGGGGGTGSYALTVTASAPGVQHSVGLTLNVE